MRPKITFLSVSIIIIHLFLFNISNAQIRKGGGGRKGSLYFSGGMNTESYNKPTLTVNQPSLGNNYTLSNVSADNKTGSAFSPTLMNFRIGYYFGYFQKYGIELDYDPVKYHVTDGQTVVQKGTINDLGVNQPITFSAKKGYIYSLDGANLMLVDLVRRFTLYRPNSNKIAVDAIAKAGVGPAMPNVTSTISGKKFAAPGFAYGGINMGVEGALRVTFYRYIYLEFAAKYDYAALTGLQIYEGTVQQNLRTLEYIGSLGFTFPTRRFNPLFYKGKRIITILPLSTLKEHPGKNFGETRKERKRREREQNVTKEEMTDIPEFGDIVDRKEKLQAKDSMMRKAYEDSVFKSMNPPDTTAVPHDSTVVKDTTEPKKGRKKRRHKHDEEQTLDSTVIKPAMDGATNNEPSGNGENAIKKDTVTPAPKEKMAEPEHKPDTTMPVKEAVEEKVNRDSTEMSSKERKKLERKAKKEQEAKEKEAQQLAEQKAKEEQDRLDAIKKAQEQAEQNRADSVKNAQAEQERLDKQKKEQEKLDLEKKEQDLKNAEEAKKQAIKDTLEKRKQEREEEKARKEKEREELKEKRAKELEELKAKREQEREELKAKREQEKKEREEKLQKEKEEREKAKSDTTSGK